MEGEQNSFHFRGSLSAAGGGGEGKWGAPRGAPLQGSMTIMRISTPSAFFWVESSCFLWHLVPSGDGWGS